MRVLFDQGTPGPLRHAITSHTVETAYERGWSTLDNGDLIAAAESAGFEVLLTTDKNLKYQQSLVGRRIAILVLQTTSWPRLQNTVPKILAAVDGARPGCYTEIGTD